MTANIETGGGQFLVGCARGVVGVFHSSEVQYLYEGDQFTYPLFGEQRTVTYSWSPDTV